VRVLLIGYNEGVLSALDGVWPAGSVVVLEEPDLWEAKALAAKAKNHPSLGNVLFGRYQQDRQFLTVLDRVGPVDAVAAGLEYAVVAAAEAAESMGLPGPGVDAARVLRDKLLLRERAAAAGMLGPSFQEVRSAKDLATFARGRDCVVKPAGRQASVGVLLLEAGDDPELAWTECSQADEGPQIAKREMDWRYLVEERLYGSELSTEALVRDGRIVFLNVTRKLVAPGRRPIELGHVVPGAVDELDHWHRAAQALVDAVEYGTGLIHAEWIETDGGRYLIECASRPPGDKIMDLIDLAHGFNLSDTWLRLLAGETPRSLPAPGMGAAIRFLSPRPGRVEAVKGVPEALELPGVIRARVTCKPGDQLGELRSSWDRIGWVIAVGPDARTADARAAGAASSIAVEVGLD
jgi:biotin carboxylase